MPNIWNCIALHQWWWNVIEFSVWKIRYFVMAQYGTMCEKFFFFSFLFTISVWIKVFFPSEKWFWIKLKYAHDLYARFITFSKHNRKFQVLFGVLIDAFKQNVFLPFCYGFSHTDKFYKKNKIIIWNLKIGASASIYCYLIPVNCNLILLWENR